MDSGPGVERLSGAERWLALQVLLLLPLVSLALRLWGFRRCYAGLGWLAPGLSRRATRTGDALAEARQVAAVALVATMRYALCPPACLAQSLTLWFLLRRRGIAADLRLGVRTVTGQFQAHAWVEVGGVVLNDDPDVQQIYHAFDLIPITPRCSDLTGRTRRSVRKPVRSDCEPP